MAAPSTVYKDFKTRRRKAGTPDVDIDLFIAKFLQNTTPPSGDNWGDGYFNSTDTEAQKIAKIKDIFKIDGWIQVAKGTATTPDMGFIGYCNSRASGNGLYHKTERFSGVRVPTTAQASAELLNDAGLNRKGHTEILSVLSTSSTAHTDSPTTYKPRLNDVAVWGRYRSAFYASSTKYIQVQNPISGIWQNMGAGDYLHPKILAVEKINTFDTSLLERTGNYNFRTLITNEEGDYASAALLASVYRGVATMKYDPTYASDAFYYGTNKTIYYSTSEIISAQGGIGLDATDFAKNDVIEMASGDIADYGFYAYGGMWYKFEYSVTLDAPLVTQMGLCQKWDWPTDDPAYQFEPIFSNIVAGEFEEATYAVTYKTLTLTPSSADYTTTPPSFPSASYNIYLEGSVVLTNTDLYFYIQDTNETKYYIGTGNTGAAATKNFTFSGSFSALGFAPLAGETYQVFITDTSL